MQDAHNLTGAWDGLYSYPDMLQPTAFKATLMESATALSGETQEVADTAFGPLFGDTLHATLTGWRGGRRVEFRKAYLGLGPQHGSRPHPLRRDAKRRRRRDRGNLGHPGLVGPLPDGARGAQDRRGRAQDAGDG